MTSRKQFLTKKGTELPLLNLKGKEYLQVAHRLQWFVEENPNYDISTQFLTLDNDKAIAKTTLTIFETKEQGQNVVKKVSATKSETAKSFPDFIEKAETGSIGRALAMLGYGTQFTGDELDEGTRLADSPVPSPVKEVSSEAKENNSPSSFSSRRKKIAAKTTETADLDI